MKTDKYYGAEKTAGFLGCSRNTLPIWRAKGILKSSFRTPGGLHKYSWREIYAFMKRAKYPIPEDFMAEDPRKKK